MTFRVQEFIHKLEEGVGNRYLKFVLGFFAMFGAAVAYDMAAYRNLSTAEGMDEAQLAWNISEGRGFTTWFIRPFSVHLIRKQNQPPAAATSEGKTNSPAGDPGRLNAPHPDLANGPLYPLLLAGFFKVLQLSHPDVSSHHNFTVYTPDLWIGVFNQILLAVSAILVFLLARRLFDEPAAWAAAVALVGAELFWRFTLSGLPTLLLVAIVLSLFSVLVRLEPAMREGTHSHRALALMAAAAGALAALAGLTRYSFAWLIVPLVLWLSTLAGPKRPPLALSAVGAFLMVMTPWLVRNYVISGTLFGTAGFAIFEHTAQFPEGELQRALNADFSGITFSELWHKLLENTRSLVQNDLPRLGGSWVSAFFLVGLLVPFRNPTLNRLRWFLILCLGVMIPVQALGRTTSVPDGSLLHAENLLVVFAPLVFIYGVSLFFILFEQVAAQFPTLRFVGQGVFYLVICSPLIFTMFPPYPSPIIYPPYYPPWIQEKAGLVDKEGLIMADVPWAVAWYGQRPSVGLTLRHRSNPSDRYKNDFYEVQTLKPVNALYLTAKTLKSLELRALVDWLDTDPDAVLLNRLRQRVVENEGREDKKEDDFRLFAAVRERLVANASREDTKGESWDHFVLQTFLRSEVPTGFPLQRAPQGLFPELFLTETERRKQKTIQSSK